MFRVVCAVVGGLMLAPLTAVLGAAPTSATATDLCAQTDVPPGMTKYEWDGGGATDSWDLALNWDVSGEPDPDGVPNYFGTPESDDSTTGYVCIPSQVSPLTITLDDNVNVHVVSLEVGDNVTIDSGFGARIWVYGAPAEYESRFHDESTVKVNGSTLGGPGLIRAEGLVEWRSIEMGAATFDTDFCAELEDLDDLTAGCGVDPPPGPGRLRIEAGGELVVPGRGVNLKDGYGIDVVSGGAVYLQGDGYIAADRETSITVDSGGLFEFQNDGSVFEGVTRAAGDQLARFVNEGTLRKSAGTGRSAVVARYSGGGAIEVEDGTIDILDGTTTTAHVDAGGGLGTGRCQALAVGELDATCQVEVTAQDPQNALLTLPPGTVDPDGAAVAVAEGAAVEDPTQDVAPPVDVAVNGLAAGGVVELELELLTTLPRLPRNPAKLTLFQRRAQDDVDRELRRCNDDPDHSIPTGVTACVVRVHAPDGNRTRILIKTTKPTGRWTARRQGPDRKTVATTRETVGGASSPFDYDVATDALTPLTLVPVNSCGPVTTTSWSRVTRWRRQALDSRAIGWDPNGTGRALTLNGQVGNLDRLEGFDIGLQVVRGAPRGFVRAVRHSSASVRWVGLAEVDLGDAPIAGVPFQPDWRILDGTPLTLTWTRYEDGVATDTVAATIADLVKDGGPADTKTQDSAFDTVGIGFGCNGEAVVLDDFRVFREDDLRDDQWNLEAPKPTIKFETLTSVGCRVSSDWARGRVFLDTPGDWRLWWSNDGGDSKRTLLPLTRSTERRFPIEFELPYLPRGRVELIAPSSRLGQRTDTSGSYAMPSTPRIVLTKITRRVPVDKKIVIKGRVLLPGVRQVRLYMVEKGDQQLNRTSVTAQTTNTGAFVLRRPAPSRETKFALAVFAGGGDGWASAISSRALIARVFRPAVPDPVQPPATTPDDSDQTPVQDTDTTDQLLPSERAAACAYRLRAPLR